jgi:hypothetical protein
MQARITQRPLARWALLPAIAVGALLAGLPTASARDQQATGTQIDNDLSWRAATGTGAYGGAYGPVYGGSYGAYAEAPRERVHTRTRRDDYRGDRDDR